MASTITNYSSNIDKTFPIPGQDNDTQGFRDNFIAINNAFNTAAAEISDIQVIQTGLISRALVYSLAQPVSSVGTSGDTKGMIYATSSTIYVCYADYVSPSTNIWAKVSTDSGSW